jgi:hypothetical protein
MRWVSSGGDFGEDAGKFRGKSSGVWVGRRGRLVVALVWTALVVIAG